ncbi:hypothetical protein AABB02_15575 [Streptomyces rimosus]
MGTVLRDGEGSDRVLLKSRNGIAWQAKALDLRLATKAEQVMADADQKAE